MIINIKPPIQVESENLSEFLRLKQIYLKELDFYNENVTVLKNKKHKQELGYFEYVPKYKIENITPEILQYIIDEIRFIF